eukprot:3527677-Rhodomonas_salina.5
MSAGHRSDDGDNDDDNKMMKVTCADVSGGWSLGRFSGLLLRAWSSEHPSADGGLLVAARDAAESSSMLQRAIPTLLAPWFDRA